MLKNGIDPKVGLWVNVAFLVLTAVGAGAIVLAGVPDSTALIIKTWAANGALVISAANVVFGFYSSSTPGPGVAK